jgi:transcriptional regulator with PAS, ATPase and Fis domain
VGGAFTGARREGSPGQIRMADGGTLFLDEVGDMPLSLQAKLLRVLQEREVEPLGSNRVVPVDLRVIAATSVDLERRVADGSFRADLFYRLNVLPIRLPPLRDRRDDLGLLCEHLLEEIALEHGTLPKEIDPQALAVLAQRDWPGNIRELRNVLEQACSIWDGWRLTPEALGACDDTLPPGRPAGDARTAEAGEAQAQEVQSREVQSREVQETASNAGGVQPLADPSPAETLPARIARVEREAIREALAATRGNRVQAARRLGIARATLYQKLAEHPDLSALQADRT